MKIKTLCSVCGYLWYKINVRNNEGKLLFTGTVKDILTNKKLLNKNVLSLDLEDNDDDNKNTITLYL